MACTFLKLSKLAQRHEIPLNTLYTARQRGRGPFSEIITKFGGSLGVWEDDLESYVRSQRRLVDPAPTRALSGTAAATAKHDRPASVARRRKSRRHDAPTVVT